MKNVFNSEFKCQRVASAISGWDPLDTGARDDWYYEECHNDLEKLEHIIHYSYDVLKIELNGIELLCVFNYLRRSFLIIMKKHIIFII